MCVCVHHDAQAKFIRRAWQIKRAWRARKRQAEIKAGAAGAGGMFVKCACNKGASYSSLLLFPLATAETTTRCTDLSQLRTGYGLPCGFRLGAQGQRVVTVHRGYHAALNQDSLPLNSIILLQKRRILHKHLTRQPSPKLGSLISSQQ